MTEFDITLPDGRTLHGREDGDPAGSLVIYHHGTPGSGRVADAWVAEARTRGIRLVSYDRPGYGGSTRDRGRTIASCVADTAAVADHLGAARFTTFGVSGGGPHALACAALLPERVGAAASLGGIAPYDAQGLDFLAGMGQDNIDEFGATVRGEDELAAWLAPARAGLLASTPASIAAEMTTLLPPVDVAWVEAGGAEHLHDSMSTGLRTSADGWLDDDLAFAAPWGIDLAAITVPTLLVQGDQDLMVPFAHGQWLARHVAGATVWLRPGEGHLSLLTGIGDVFDWMQNPTAG